MSVLMNGLTLNKFLNSTEILEKLVTLINICLVWFNMVLSVFYGVVFFAVKFVPYLEKVLKPKWLFVAYHVLLSFVDLK